MSAYRIMETIDLDGWAKNVVEAHAPKKKAKPPDLYHLDLAQMCARRWHDQVMCRECQKPVDRVEVVPSAALDELVVSVWCHGELRQRAVRRIALVAARAHGAGKIVEVLHEVICDPWFWPMPPPGPEVP